MNTKKGFSGIYILVGILAIAAIAGGAYFLGKSGRTQQVVSQPQPTLRSVQASLGFFGYASA